MALGAPVEGEGEDAAREMSVTTHLEGNDEEQLNEREGVLEERGTNSEVAGVDGEVGPAVHGVAGPDDEAGARERGGVSAHLEALGGGSNYDWPWTIMRARSRIESAPGESHKNAQFPLRLSEQARKLLSL